MSLLLPALRPVIPDHRLITLIGGGSYGQIWLAQNVAGAYRAIKVVSRSNFHSDRPYEREFEGLQRFEPISRSHEGFLQILHIGRNDAEGYFYYVMELGDSQDDAWQQDPSKYSPRTLSSELVEHLRLPLDRCLEVGLELSAALARLHLQGLVHRDLKPANIVFVNRRPKLADIGLVTEAGNSVTFVGTEGYVPREGPGAPNADIYALGKILYEMATGFDCSRFPDLPEEPPTPVGSLTFAEWNEVVCKCCDEDPWRRYQHAEDLRFHLSLLKAGSSLRRLLRLERTLQRVRRLALPGLLMLVAAAAVGFSVWRSRQDAAVISRREFELSQRKVGSFVATGGQAMQNGDFSGALPWFTAALALLDNDPMALETHRTRMAAVLDRSPQLKQLWFSEHEARFGQFTTNGESALVQTQSGRFQLRRVSDGASLSPEFGSLRGEELACLSADATLALTSSRREMLIRLWDLRGDKPVGQVQFHSWVTAARLSPNADRVVVGLYDGSVVIHHLATQRQVVLRAHSKRVLHVTFDRHGDRLLTCGEDGQACVWQGGTGERISRFQDHANWVTWGAFSPDGSRVVTAGFDRTLRVWNPVDGAALLPAPFELASVARSVEFTADGRHLVISDFEFRVLVLDALDGQRAGPVFHHGEHVVFADASPSGDRLLSVSQDGTTRIWQIPQKVPVSSWTVLDFQPLAQRGIVLTNGRFAELELPLGPIRAQRNEILEDGAPLALARFLADGQSFATLSDVVTADTDPEPMRVLKRIDFAGEASDSFSLRLPAAFDRFLGLGSQRSFAVWSTNVLARYELGAARQSWQVEFGGLRLHQVFPNSAGERIAVALTGRAGHSLQLLDSSDGRSIWGGPVQVKGEIKAVAFSQDGQWLAVACSSSPARSEAAFVFECRSGRLVREPFSHRDGVLSVAFSPSGKALVTCGEDKTTLIRSLESGQQLVRPLLHQEQVLRAVFSWDGRWLATLCKNQVLQVWDVGTGDPITPPIDLPGRCNQVAFHPQAHGVWAWAPSDGQLMGEVCWVPLRRETRSLDELAAIARVLSAQYYHFSGGLLPSPRKVLDESWSKVQSP